MLNTVFSTELTRVIHKKISEKTNPSIFICIIDYESTYC